MAKANLIVTFDPTHSTSAKKEIENLVKEIKETAKILSCEEGLAQVVVKDARAIVKALSKIKKDKFAYTFHWIPMDKWCKSTIADMQKVVKDIAKDISAADKWKMEISKHKSDLHDKELIIKLTEVIDKPKVDLENPDKTVWVEVVGNEAGIALLKKGDFLKILK